MELQIQTFGSVLHANGKIREGGKKAGKNEGRKEEEEREAEIFFLNLHFSPVKKNFANILEAVHQ